MVDQKTLDLVTVRKAASIIKRIKSDYTGYVDLAMELEKVAARLESGYKVDTGEAEKTILDEILLIEPGARNQAPVWIPDLWACLQSEMPKEIFDAAMLKMFDVGKIILNRHNNPGHVTPIERNQFVCDKHGTCYVVVALRKEIS